MGVVQNDIAGKDFKKAYLLYGEEAYLRKYYKNALKNALVNEGDNLNYSYFEGTGVNPDEVKDLLLTMPFMAEHRVVICENTGWFQKAGGDSAEEDSGKEASTGKYGELIDAIKNLPDETVVIFSEEKADKRSKLYKAVLGSGVCEEYAKQTDDMLARWLTNLAKASERTIRPDVAYYLISECGSDMLLLENEMEKLIAFTMGRDFITAEDIDTVCTHQVNGKIFDMITAIAAHKQKEALRLYYDLLTLRESPFHILTLLVRQYSQMLSVKDGMNRNVPPAMIAKKIGSQDWIVKKISDQVRRMNINDIKKNLEACTKADENIKNGNITDMMSVELLIISGSM